MRFAAEVLPSREEGSQEQRCAARARPRARPQPRFSWERAARRRIPESSGPSAWNRTFGFHPPPPFSSSPGFRAKLLVRINFLLSLPDPFIFLKRKKEIFRCCNFFLPPSLIGVENVC